MNTGIFSYKLDKTRKNALRAKLFKHLDGFAIAPAMLVLKKQGILDTLAQQKKEAVLLSDLCTQTKAHDGYLQVALRSLCSQDWLQQTILTDGKDISYQLTSKGKIAIQWANCYQEIVAEFPTAINMDAYLFPTQKKETAAVDTMTSLYEAHAKDSTWKLPKPQNDLETEVHQQMQSHLEGLLVGPILVALGMKGFWQQFHPSKKMNFTTADLVNSTNGNEKRLTAVLQLLTQLNWLQKEDAVTYTFTPKGWFFARRATAYGVTVSYLPTFNWVEKLIFENPYLLWQLPEGVTDEVHVNRTMNVWGSGGAHTTYFRKIDEIVIDIFNRPIEQQPKGFADIGCGNGALIEHLFDIIYEHTERGKMLAKHPLFIVGADFNRAALIVTKQNLLDADVWANVEYGDISDPDLLAQNIRNKHQVELHDLLSVRSFLDHNRIYKQPETIEPNRQSTTTGAYAYRGRRLTAKEVEQDLVNHLKRWTPHINKFGLLVLELHTIAPELAAKNIGKTAVTAYDATHGYSDQYIVELPVFLNAAKEVGLQQVTRYQAMFPPSELVTVSINLLNARN